MLTRLRTEIILTDEDIDIIEAIEQSGMKRASFFRYVAREHIRRKEEERFDERVKRLLTEVLADRGEVKTVQTVESKKRLGFGAKRV